MVDTRGALLIFAIGALVTLATVVMIVRGHARWRGRDPYDDPIHGGSHD